MVIVDPDDKLTHAQELVRDKARARVLFKQFRQLDPQDPQYARTRDELVELHLPLAKYLANKFASRGEPVDDLIQVATIGLIKGVDKFDLDRGVEFTTYATPTISGEIKRHFRDKGWTIRVPRRLQELKLNLTRAANDLSQKLGRSPTVPELATHLKMSEDEVLEGLETANAYSAISLDSPSGDEDSPSIADSLGFSDGALDNIEFREALKPLIGDLTPRERQILSLRFFQDKTQSEIAQFLGISQMHVSRLLTNTLNTLKDGLLRDD